MRYYNADGGEAEMCGNGARCFARFAGRLGGSSAEMSFETLAGIIKASFRGDLVCITMSEPNSYRAPFDLAINGRSLNVHFLNTGVPHAVVFAEDIAAIDVDQRWSGPSSPPSLCAPRNECQFRSSPRAAVHCCAHL